MAIGCVVAFASDGINLFTGLFSDSEKETLEKSIVSPLPSSADNKQDKPLSIAEFSDENVASSNSNNNNNKVKTSAAKPNIPEVSYFNTSELILEDRSIALFVKNDTNTMDRDFIENLSLELEKTDIQTSISFFNNASLGHYDSFYSANKKWLSKIKLSEYLNTYLIGSIREDKTNGSFDNEVTIINLTFKGKLINLKDNSTIPIHINSSESSFDKRQALVDANKSLIDDILKSISNSI